MIKLQGALRAGQPQLLLLHRADGRCQWAATRLESPWPAEWGGARLSAAPPGGEAWVPVGQTGAHTRPPRRPPCASVRSCGRGWHSAPSWAGGGLQRARCCPAPQGGLCPWLAEVPGLLRDPCSAGDMPASFCPPPALAGALRGWAAEGPGREPLSAGPRASGQGQRTHPHTLLAGAVRPGETAGSWPLGPNWSPMWGFPVDPAPVRGLDSCLLPLGRPELPCLPGPERGDRDETNPTGEAGNEGAARGVSKEGAGKGWHGRVALLCRFS